MADPLFCSWSGARGQCAAPVVYRLISTDQWDREIALACRAHLGQLVAEALDEVENALGVEVGRA